MSRRHLHRPFAIALMFLVFAAPLAGRQGGFTLKVDVSLIPVDVAVYDSQGNTVKTLTSDDFVLYEDGTPQEIRHFETVDAPYKILLLFDTSGSTRNQLGFMMDAANRVLQTLRRDDQVAIASFTVGVTKLLDWRTRLGSSQQVAIPPGRGGTDLFGALEWTVRELNGISGRKGVLVLTDGLDGSLTTPNERAAFQQARTAVEHVSAPFYFVAVPGAAPEAILTRARQRMSELADRSGGRVIYPTTIADVASLFERIARELGSSYSMAYETSRPQKDGTYRRIDVRLKPPGLRVSQSRTGYYAWAGDSPAPLQAPPPQLPPQQTSRQPVSLPQRQPPPSRVPAPVQPATQPQISALPQSQQQPSTAPAPLAAPFPVVPNSAPAGGPVLITPINYALLPSPDRESWRFDWEDVTNASRYQIIVSAPGEAVSIIEAESRSSQYVSPAKRVRNPGPDARGWSWKVRAQRANGEWGPWSESRVFDVFVNEPVP